jgi:hypothetical protein
MLAHQICLLRSTKTDKLQCTQSRIARFSAQHYEKDQMSRTYLIQLNAAIQRDCLEDQGYEEVQ